jgi:acyl-coenzyme A thioesterase PaaI-like protein
MPESFASKLLRWKFNLFPAYRGTGGRITYISADVREIHVRLPLSWRTRNYVGTIFGGSIYAALDPIYMIMLIRALGPGYVVWDKAASVRFKLPGRSTLHAHFRLDEDEVRAIKSELEEARSIDRVYGVELKDAAGKVHATVEKTIYIRRRDAGGKSEDAGGKTAVATESGASSSSSPPSPAAP